MTQVNSYSSLNTYRSAIAYLSDSSLGEAPDIKRFFKGVSVIKPAQPKYEHTWDPEIVLSKLEQWYPNNDCSLQQLTKKVITLLALVTAQRIQTLATIDIKNISIVDNITYIKIPDRTKTSGTDEYNPLLTIPMFPDQPARCAASALHAYIKKTESLRSNSKLFITCKKPHGPASKQTISNWVKKTLQESGVDTDTFTAHSTRHASTSAAARKGRNIETIRKTAGWTSKSKVFGRFYNRPVRERQDFAAAIIEKT